MKQIRLSSVLSIVVIAIGYLLIVSNAQTHYDVSDYRRTMIRMAAAAQDVRSRIPIDEKLFTDIGNSGDQLYIAPLLDTAYFLRGSSAGDSALFALEKLTGMPANTGWQGFFEWASEQDVALPPHYDEFKGLVLGSVVDPEFVRFFEPGVQDTAQVNLVEAVWGGVRVDGIPSLVNAKQITPESATEEGLSLSQYCREGDCAYPAADELVFGVSINGDSRAYPLRLLNWHEMFNDVIGHTPMFSEVGGEQICHFRAPTEFTVHAYQTDLSGQNWVQIQGESAACPEAGFLAADALAFSEGDWQGIKQQLPNLNLDETPLASSEITGHVKGKPVMLAYCTLCGSGVLFDTTIPELTYTSISGEQVSTGETVLEFGSTGMLMRSNKLMYDRHTDTVWNALTGVPAFGPLVSADLKLERLPVVVTDWSDWLETHPDTSVLSLDTGVRRNYTNGGAYGDYFNNPDFVMFPVWQQDTREQANKDMVFALELSGTSKAYPLDILIEEQVTNDELAGQELVLVTEASPERDFFEPGGAAVRAYERSGRTFSLGSHAKELIDETGAAWQVTEDALISETGEVLPRVAGQLAFWFGWFGFNPDTLVHEAQEGF